MKNDTLRILEELFYKRQRELLPNDPEWAELERGYQELDQEFQKKHQGNHILIQEVNCLLDGLCFRAEYEKLLWLFWGLQIGIDLGSLDLLREW